MVSMRRYRVVHLGIGGAPYLSTHWFSGTQGTESDCRQAALGFWTDSAAERIAGVASTGDTVVDIIESEDGSLIGSTPVSDWTVTATGTGEVLPLATQGLLRLDTGVIVGGRRIRGHLYLPAPTEADSDDGGPAAAYRTTYESAWADNMDDAPISPVVWSRVNGAMVTIQQGAVWDNWAVLRSRRD